MGLEFLFKLPIDEEFENSFFYNEEAVAKLSRLKDEIILIDIAIEHFLFDVLKFAFREIVEDEVVFEAVNDEIGVMKCFLFGDEFYIFSNSDLDSLNFFGLVMGEELSLGFGPDGRLFA